MKWYLGIEAHRIATIGFGASKPIADNTTNEGAPRTDASNFAWSQAATSPALPIFGDGAPSGPLVGSPVRGDAG
ncbi:MAG: hypothetical protein GY811_13925 [Myxococcales bacterium]|nr:hypothetical protein [Myxococcales bacterium]